MSRNEQTKELLQAIHICLVKCLFEFRYGYQYLNISDTNNISDNSLNSLVSGKKKSIRETEKEDC